MNRSAWYVAAVAMALLVVAAASVYTVDSREVAIVLSFGAPRRTVMDPGLYFRAPWPIQEVVRFDRRARVLAVAPSEVLTKDKKNLVVEAFAIWRVSEPQKFLESFQSTRTGGVLWEDLAAAAEVRLSDLVIGRIASAIAQKEFGDVLVVGASSEDLLPADVAAEVAQTAASRFGIHLLDMRLRHVGLPLQNEQSIYERMRAERLRIANAYRSEGEEKATTIRAQADRQAAEILAEADKQTADILAGSEAAAARLYAEAYREDPEFYRYLRSLESVKNLVGGTPDASGKRTKRSTIVLESDSQPFQLLHGRSR